MDRAPLQRSVLGWWDTPSDFALSPTWNGLHLGKYLVISAYSKVLLFHILFKACDSNGCVHPSKQCTNSAWLRIGIVPDMCWELHRINSGPHRPSREAVYITSPYSSSTYQVCGLIWVISKNMLCLKMWQSNYTVIWGCLLHLYSVVWYKFKHILTSFFEYILHRWY